MIYRDLGIFWRSLGKKMPFWVKNSISWKEVHYYMVYIAYFTELNLQNYVQKRRICRKIVNTCLTTIFMAIFAPDERLPSSATLDPHRHVDFGLGFVEVSLNMEYI